MRKLIVGMGYLHVALILAGTIIFGKEIVLGFFFCAAGFVKGMKILFGNVSMFAYLPEGQRFIIICGFFYAAYHLVLISLGVFSLIKNGRDTTITVFVLLSFVFIIFFTYCGITFYAIS